MARARTLFGLHGVVMAAALLGLLWIAPGAGADSIAVQPDGRIVVIGEISPQAGVLVRLEPDGTVDRSFGRDGFAIDRRLPSLTSVALAGDAGIVGAAGGVRLVRYLPNGAPDPKFANGGVGGSDEPDQPLGPAAMAMLPGGSTVVAEVDESSAGGFDSQIQRYDANGAFLETVGRIPNVGLASSAAIADLVPDADGSLLGAGSTYESGAPRGGVLARFLPGSGTDYDPSFGGGAERVRLDLPSPGTSPVAFRALARDGGKIVAAGSAENGFLVARFAADGTLDPSFGDGGRVVLPIAGPSTAAWWAASWAADAAPLGSGEVLLGGGTSEWGKPLTGKLQNGCGECPQPLLAVVDAAGTLDPRFGSGGFLRLLKPNGGILDGVIEQVVPLSDGKILVKGAIPILETAGLKAPFLARLNPDGSYDPTFGEGGLTVVDFPCTDQPRAERKRAGCIPSLRAKLGVGGLLTRRPALSLQVQPSFKWAALGDLTLTLPKYLRLTRHFRSKLLVWGGGDVAVHVTPPRQERPYTVLSFDFGARDLPRELRVRLGRGALHLQGRLPRRGLTFKLRAHFLDARWGSWGGHDEITRRARQKRRA